MELHQLRYFLALAEHLNFTKAAESLRVAQPSLTRGIQKLEQEIAGPLFRRERSHTHMTDLGRVIHPHLAAAFAAAAQAKARAREFHERSRGRLSLGACDLSPAEALEPVLVAAKQDLAHLELNVEVAPAATIKEGLLAGRFDAAILNLLSTRDRASGRMDLHPLEASGFVIAFPAGHRFAAGREATLEMLDGEAMIERTNGHYEQALTAAMARRGLRRVIVHRSNDQRWIGRLVRLGAGCALLPQSAATLEDLPFVPLADVSFGQRIVFATIAGRRHSPALARLMRATKNLRPQISRSASAAGQCRSLTPGLSCD